MRRSGPVWIVLSGLTLHGTPAGAVEDEKPGPERPWSVRGCTDLSGREIECGYAAAVPAPPLRPAPAAPGSVFADGLVALDEGRLAEAERLLRRAARGEPAAVLALAWTLHLRAKHAEAEDAFRRARALGLATGWIDANLPALTARYNEGLDALVAARPRDAEPLLRMAQVAAPGWRPANALGVALAGQGRYAEACAAFREAVRHAAGDLTASPAGLALLQRNLAFALHRQGRADEARAAITRALELVPDDPEFKALALQILPASPPAVR